jgi:transposase
LFATRSCTGSVKLMPKRLAAHGRLLARRKYTLEFKLETVRLVKGGQSAAVTAKVLGVPKANVSNWVRLSDSGKLTGAGDKPVTPEQMELARLRAELARMTMERDIAKKAAAYFAQDLLQGTPGFRK